MGLAVGPGVIEGVGEGSGEECVALVRVLLPLPPLGTPTQGQLHTPPGRYSATYGHKHKINQSTP